VTFAEQNRNPIRVGHVWLLNEPRLTNFLWSLAKPFLKKKIIDRTHFIGRNYEVFLQNFSPYKIPKELGGEYTVNFQDWVRNLIRAESGAKFVSFVSFFFFLVRHHSKEN
jgi:hypothetical protein